jgi:hypothetical protein
MKKLSKFLPGKPSKKLDKFLNNNKHSITEEDSKLMSVDSYLNKNSKSQTVDFFSGPTYSYPYSTCFVKTL